VLETDSYLAVPQRKRNESSYLVHIIDKLRLYMAFPNDIKATTENSEAIFWYLKL
jgi:Tat protein secretion system quality control protein TatD with DNase activity